MSSGGRTGLRAGFGSGPDRLGLLTQADQGGDRAPRDPGEVVDNPWAIGHARSPVGLAVPSPYNPTP